MKTIIKSQNLYLILTTCILMVASSLIASPLQKKVKVRLSVQYVKEMNNQSYLQIQTKAKGKKGYQPVSGLKLNIYQVFDDSTSLLGEVTTQADGSARFIFQALVMKLGDETGLYSYEVTHEQMDQFKAGTKKVKFYDANLTAKIVTKDEVNYVSANLTELYSGTPVEGERVNVDLKRLFRSLQIGKSSYKTDENGSILVAIEEGIPGIDGILTFEVMIDDSDDYGTVKTTLTAAVGVPVVTTDTFDQRTMWSPPSKTPYYMLIVPNIIIFGIWLTLVLLTLNLYKISKSKN